MCAYETDESIPPVWKICIWNSWKLPPIPPNTHTNLNTTTTHTQLLCPWIKSKYAKTVRTLCAINRKQNSYPGTPLTTLDRHTETCKTWVIPHLCNTPKQKIKQKLLRHAPIGVYRIRSAQSVFNICSPHNFPVISYTTIAKIVDISGLQRLRKLKQ